MAERRMFAKSIIDSDEFLDMPSSAQNLYFHLAMRADDEGFVNSPKRIQKITNCADDDFKLLILKRFIIPFECGVCVIKHWRIHNYIQSDRKKETNYPELLAQLGVKKNKAYTMKNQENEQCIQDVYKTDTSCTPSIGKDRLELGKDSIDPPDEPAEVKPEINIPPEIATKFNSFVKMRKATRHKLTNDGIIAALEKLNKLSNGDFALQNEILDNSIIGSYQGLFLPSNRKTEPTKQGGTAAMTEEEMHDIFG